MKKLIVHRKGATRVFSPGFEELRESLLKAGQLVIIPGSMGTCSCVLAGTEKSLANKFNCTGNRSDSK